MKGGRAMTPLRGKAAASFEAGRVCTRPTCTTVLARYNPEPTCAVHSADWPRVTARTRR